MGITSPKNTPGDQIKNRPFGDRLTAYAVRGKLAPNMQPFDLRARARRIMPISQLGRMGFCVLGEAAQQG